MATHEPVFKLYSTNTTTGGSKTLTEKHPKLTATATEFSDASRALAYAYGVQLDEVTLQSETTVFVRS